MWGRAAIDPGAGYHSPRRRRDGQRIVGERPIEGPHVRARRVVADGAVSGPGFAAVHLVVRGKGEHLTAGPVRQLVDRESSNRAGEVGLVGEASEFRIRRPIGLAVIAHRQRSAADRGGKAHAIGPGVTGDRHGERPRVVAREREQRIAIGLEHELPGGLRVQPRLGPEERTARKSRVG
jgi:hypothetical protein